jgi:hypothetical protein
VIPRGGLDCERPRVGLCRNLRDERLRPLVRSPTGPATGPKEAFQCFLSSDDVILGDIERQGVRDDVLVRTCCWGRISQLRGRTLVPPRTARRLLLVAVLGEGRRTREKPTSGAQRQTQTGPREQELCDCAWRSS